jgi:uncharacterized FlgJ-related protein
MCMAIWYKKYVIDKLDKAKGSVDEKFREAFPRRVINKIKIFLYKVFAVIVVIFAAYIYGTFNPNSSIVDKIRKEEDKRMVEMAKQFGLHEPEFKYNGPKTFVQAMNKCIDYINWTLPLDQRIPRDILVAMAIVESDYGKSRFAVEGNALFGVRTWNLDTVPHMKPGAIPNARFGVKKYVSKCQSVEDVIDIINRHPAYEPFRSVRNKNRYEPNITQMVFGLSAWSTNEEYPQIILQKIEQLTNK